MMALGNDDLYEKLTDENSKMEMYRKPDLLETIKPYAYAFAFTIGVIMPWCIGWAMLIKWGVKAIF